MNDVYFRYGVTPSSGRTTQCRDTIYVQYYNLKLLQVLYVRHEYGVVSNERLERVRSLLNELAAYFPEPHIYLDERGILNIPACINHIPYWLSTAVFREVCRSGSSFHTCVTIANLLAAIAPYYGPYRLYNTYWEDLTQNDARMYGRTASGHLTFHVRSTEQNIF